MSRPLVKRRWQGNLSDSPTILWCVLELVRVRCSRRSLGELGLLLHLMGLLSSAWHSLLVLVTRFMCNLRSFEGLDFASVTDSGDCLDGLTEGRKAWGDGEEETTDLRVCSSCAGYTTFAGDVTFILTVTCDWAGVSQDCMLPALTSLLMSPRGRAHGCTRMILLIPSFCGVRYALAGSGAHLCFGVVLDSQGRIPKYQHPF